MNTLPYANRLLDPKNGSVWPKPRRPDISIESAGWTFDENPNRLSVPCYAVNARCANNNSNQP